MVQTESQSKKSNLIRRILFYFLRLCKLSENKAEEDSDYYLKLVDKLRETKLTARQMPTCVGCAKSHINQYLLPCEHIVCETCFIEKDQEDNISLKCPQCQTEYFINWHSQQDPQNIYSAVNTEARRTQQIDHHFKETKKREPASKNWLERSNCHPDGFRSNTDHSEKSPKPLPPLSRSPTHSGKHWKRHPLNPFSSMNQYQVLGTVPDPQECQESGDHDSKFLPKAPPQEERESDPRTLLIENAELLGQRKQKC
ncbi:uncharacterized protein LOC119954442 [Scyliorhinus canicula]|uniref:uncharacterized protein LOC119954442 n=1 Tax=Scyliorhinus canicula TaxID=7830 RepID=UPI0018F76ECF|nr:uncharacterized protein LOC119954442 [Scyliorhinus canicula]